jgi:CTP:molybdopterin cytidylyltransferase MocA
MHVTGVVLAAGAGTRAGGPKALRPGWVAGAVTVLLDAGCAHVVVVLGAAPDAPVPIDPRVRTVIATDWEQGMSHSLRAGLAASAGIAALITLVDYPDMPVAVARRVLAAVGPLRQAVYGGRPGHPVYVAADHWASLIDDLDGDRGARSYLQQHGVDEVECGDLWHGVDVDSWVDVDGTLDS